MYFILQGEVGILIKIAEADPESQTTMKRKKIRCFEDLVEQQFSNFKLVATKHQFDHFGEIAIEQRIPRTASVITKSPCVFAILTYDAYQRLLQNLLEETVQLRRDTVSKFFPFSTLQEYALQQLLHGAEEIVFSQATLLFKKGQYAEEIYIIITGEVMLQCWLSVPAQEDEIRESKSKYRLLHMGLFGVGQIIGDLELYLEKSSNTRLLRQSQAIIHQGTKLLKFKLGPFMSIMNQYVKLDKFNSFLEDKYQRKIDKQIHLSRLIASSPIRALNQDKSPSPARKIVLKPTVTLNRGYSNTPQRNLLSAHGIRRKPTESSEKPPIPKDQSIKFKRAQSVLDFQYTHHKKQNSSLRVKRHFSRIGTNLKTDSCILDQKRPTIQPTLIEILRNRVRESKLFFQQNDEGYINITTQYKQRKNL